MKSILIILLLSFNLMAADIAMIAPIVFTHKVQVRWNANTEPDMAGYRVYSGLTSGGDMVDVAMDTTAIIDLAPRLDRYVDRVLIMVTAYDESGNESLPSESISLPVTQDTTNYLFGDLDNNGRVGVIDFALFTQSFGSASIDPAYRSSADFDVDGRIGTIDHLAFSINHGQIK
jgi:hypothetical protein